MKYNRNYLYTKILDLQGTISELKIWSSYNKDEYKVDIQVIEDSMDSLWKLIKEDDKSNQPQYKISDKLYEKMKTEGI